MDHDGWWNNKLITLMLHLPRGQSARSTSAHWLGKDNCASGARTFIVCFALKRSVFAEGEFEKRHFSCSNNNQYILSSARCAALGVFEHRGIRALWGKASSKAKGCRWTRVPSTRIRKICWHNRSVQLRRLTRKRMEGTLSPLIGKETLKLLTTTVRAKRYQLQNNHLAVNPY